MNYINFIYEGSVMNLKSSQICNTWKLSKVKIISLINEFFNTEKKDLTLRQSF